MFLKQGINKYKKIVLFILISFFISIGLKLALIDEINISSIVLSSLIIIPLVLSLITLKEQYLILSVIAILSLHYFYPEDFLSIVSYFLIVLLYMIYKIFLLKIGENKNIKLYENETIFYSIVLISLIALIVIKLEFVLKVMLIIGYFMLLTQKKWHKQVYTMSIMILLLFMVNGGLDYISKIKNTLSY